MNRIKVEQLNPHIFAMDDAGESMGYRVVGEQKALVIDTMNGYEDVQAVVKSVTALPLTVVNTHGHCDHIHGDIYFDEVFMHPADMELARQHAQFEEFVARMEELTLRSRKSNPLCRLFTA